MLYTDDPNMIMYGYHGRRASQARKYGVPTYKEFTAHACTKSRRSACTKTNHKEYFLHDSVS